jgi:hypothetical protein
MLGSELVSELIHEGMLHPTARQVVHRAFAKRLVKRVPVSFGKGQFLYFMPDEQEGRIKTRILQVIRRRARLNRLFEALKVRRVLPKWHAAKISGVYDFVPQRRKTDSLDKLFSDMVELRLGKIVDFSYKSHNYRFLALPDEHKSLSHLGDMCERLVEDEKLMREFLSLLVSSRLGNGFRIRPTSFGSPVSVPVDALGNCRPYLRANRKVDSKIMVEVNTLWELNSCDLEGLLDRVHAIRRELKVYSVIVYVVANLSPSALELANKIGWKAIRPSRVSRILRIENIRQQGVLLLREASSTRFRNIVRELRSLDDLKHLGNYKSIFFESMVRDFFDDMGYATRRRKKYYLDYNNELTERKTRAHAFEIDVYGERPNRTTEIAICECKYWLDPVGEEEVRKFARKLNKINEYYTKKLGKMKANVHGFFIASELPSSRRHRTKALLTILTTEGFQRYVEKELAKKHA